MAINIWFESSHAIFEIFLEEKFKFFPHFNDSSDCFEFYSDLNVSQEAFKNDLNERGYAVELFEQKLCSPCEIKEQEQ